MRSRRPDTPQPFFPELAAVVAEIADVDRRVDSRKLLYNCLLAAGEVKKFVYRNVMDLRKLLHGDAERSRPILARHIGQLTLTPKPAGPIYEVSGGLDLLVP